jgi:hypothetical protein
VTRHRKILLGAAAVTALATTATAIAEPARTASLTPGGPGFAWDSPAMNGAAADSTLPIPCGPGKDCDDTLIHAPRGQLAVKISSGDPNAKDLDLYLYRSNEQGEPGKLLKSSTSPASNEQVSVAIGGGTYLVQVVAATSAGGTFKGEAVLGELPPLDDGTQATDFGPDPAPDPSGGGGGGQTGGGNTGGSGQTVAPVTNLAPETALRRPGRRSLTGVARDRDGKVAYVDVAIVKLGSGGKCSALRVGGKFRAIRKCEGPPFLRATGTTKWKLKLKHRLAKGRYVVYALATDQDGKVEGGFGSLNRRAFRVR